MRLRVLPPKGERSFASLLRVGLGPSILVDVVKRQKNNPKERSAMALRPYFLSSANPHTYTLVLCVRFSVDEQPNVIGV